VRLILNILWVVLCGFWMALGYRIVDSRAAAW